MPPYERGSNVADLKSKMTRIGPEAQGGNRHGNQLVTEQPGDIRPEPGTGDGTKPALPASDDSGQGGQDGLRPRDR